MERKELYVVDDSADHRYLVKTIFEQFLPTYPVRFFAGAQDLYQHLIEQSSPDYEGLLPGLIMLDLRMPIIGGYELLKLLRQTPHNDNTQWRTLPVVMLSGESSRQDIELCYKAGANSFFTKPVNFDELKNLLETICQYWLDWNRLPPRPFLLGQRFA